MRITCPNCDATYEIDAGLIPAEGRDVQCSACDHVWSQTPGGVHPATAEAETAEEAGPPSGDAGTADPDPAPEEDDDALVETGMEAPRRRPDDETLRILREEAAREVAKRSAARDDTAAPDPGPPPAPEAAPRRAAPVPSRPDRDEAPRPASAERMPATAPLTAERGRGDTSTARAGAARASSESGGDLLPDLDEINSTLSGPAREREDRPEPAPGSSGGFLSGFLAILAVAVLVAALYLAAPWIAERVPALADPLAAYVGAVNTVRDRVGLQIDALAGWIATLTG